MPYIISTRHESGNAHPLARQADSLMPRYGLAVATLDEAREAAFKHMADVPRYGLADAARLSNAIHTLPEAGGTIGPLPDGTVIAVRRTDWLELAGLAGWPLDFAGRERVTGRTRKADRDALLAAFNDANS